MAASLIDQLKESGKKALEAQGQSAEIWTKLKHNKQDLEIFLQFNIAELRFKPKDAKDFKTVVCTSNTRLIKVFQAAKAADKKKLLASTPFAGIKTKDSTSVLTFNLVDNTYNTILLKAWELGSFITITEKNLEVLDALLTDLLKRKEKPGKKDDLMFFK
jgi:hypothetical protein